MDLPADLALPLTTGAPWWYWLGGRPALDLVNTRRERWWRRVETLVTASDLAQWLVEAQLVPAPPPVSGRLLTEARRLREAIDVGVEARIAGANPPDSSVATINLWLARWQSTPELAARDDRMLTLGTRAVDDPARQALAAIALDAARMLGTEERDRIRVCASESCSARFFDRSRSGQRIWCSMQGCGNMEKARRHRARVRSSG